MWTESHSEFLALLRPLVADLIAAKSVERIPDGERDEDQAEDK